MAKGEGKEENDHMIVEIMTLEHVILFKFQQMLKGEMPAPALSFSRLWRLCSNAACTMGALGIHHPLHEKKLFARQFFEAINRLCSDGICVKKEECNGERTQLISLTLTQAGREKLSEIIFAAQERAREPEVVWRPPQYRGPII
jgi:hypothetical protein